MGISRISKNASYSGSTSEPSTGTGTGIPQLVEVIHNAVIPASGSVNISLNTGYNSYELRTLRASATEENAKLVVAIYDKAISGVSEYESIEAKSIYDIINLPIKDRDHTEKIHLKIMNKSTDTQATTSVLIRITNLL